MDLQMDELNIIRSICIEVWGFDFNNRTRKTKYVLQRATYFKAARKFTDYSFKKIGQTLGKDHATVLHAVKKQAYHQHDGFTDNLKTVLKRCKLHFSSVVIHTDDPKDNAIANLQHRVEVLEKKNSILSRLAFRKDVTELEQSVEGLNDEQLNELIKYRIEPFVKMRI